MDWVRKSVLHLQRVMRKRGWRRQEAEDVIQDAFMRMQNYCNQGGEVRNPEAFLVRTALNLATNVRTRSRAHLYVEQTEEVVSIALGLEPPPEEVLAAEEALDRVCKQLDALTPRTRQIFLMHYLDGYTYPQIAQQLGISVSAVEKHMARAMFALTKDAS